MVAVSHVIKDKGSGVENVTHVTRRLLNLRSLAVFKQFEGDRKAGIRSAKAVSSLCVRVQIAYTAKLRRLLGYVVFCLM